MFIINLHYRSDKEFRGHIRKLVTDQSEILNSTEGNCALKMLSSAPFDIAENHMLFEFNNTFNCNSKYIYNSNLKEEYKRAPRAKHLFFIIEINTKKVLWEIMVDDSQVLIGPIEKNPSADKIIEWFETLKIRH